MQLTHVQHQHRLKIILISLQRPLARCTHTIIVDVVVINVNLLSRHISVRKLKNCKYSIICPVICKTRLLITAYCQCDVKLYEAFIRYCQLSLAL